MKIIKRAVLLGLLLVAVIQVWAKGPWPIPDLINYRTSDEKAKILKQVCDSLANIENFEGLKEVALFSLRLLPAEPRYIALFNYYMGSACEHSLDRDSALYYHETSLAAAREAGEGKRIRVALQRLLLLYYSAGNKVKSVQAANALQAILDTTRNEVAQYEMLVFLGNYFNENGQYGQNIQYLVRSLQIQKKLLATGKLRDSSDIAITQLNIANTFLKIKQPEKAVEYIKDSRPYTVNYEIALSFYYESIVEALLMLHSERTARMYYDSLYKKAQAGFASAYGKNDVISAELAFAEYYLLAGRKDSALLFVNRTLQKAQQWSSEYQQAQVNGLAGRLFAAMGDYRRALTYLKIAEPLNREANLESYAPVLLSMAQCYAATGQWRQASLYYSRYAPLRDSLYTEASKKSLAETEARYQNKEKKQQIEAQKVQIAYAAKQKLWLVSGLLLSGFIALLLVVIYRNKKRTADTLNDKNKKLAQLNHDLEEANRTKAKLFGIISHDLRSPISQVYQFLKLQQMAPDKLDPEQRNVLSNKIQSATGSLLETMEDLLLWSKTQMAQFNAEMQPVVINDVVIDCLRLLQLNSESKGLTIENHIPAGTTEHSDPYFLETIIRNLLQNAIKASPQGGVLTLGFTDSSLSIRNQGDYYSQQQYEQASAIAEADISLSGLGLRLVNELSEKIGLHVLFEDTGGEGTCVRLTFS